MDVQRTSIRRRAHDAPSLDAGWDRRRGPAGAALGGRARRTRRSTRASAAPTCSDFLDWALPQVPERPPRACSSSRFHGAELPEICDELGITRGQRLPAPLARHEGPRDAEGAVRRMSTTDAGPQRLHRRVERRRAPARARLPRAACPTAPSATSSPTRSRPGSRSRRRPDYDDAARAAIRAEPAVARVLAAVGDDAGLWPQLIPRCARAPGLSIGSVAAALVERFELGAGHASAPPTTSSAWSAASSSPRASRGGCSTRSASCSARAGDARRRRAARASAAPGGRRRHAVPRRRATPATGSRTTSRRSAAAAMAPAPPPMDEVDRLFARRPGGLTGRRVAAGRGSGAGAARWRRRRGSRAPSPAPAITGLSRPDRGERDGGDVVAERPAEVLLDRAQRARG